MTRSMFLFFVVFWEEGGVVALVLYVFVVSVVVVVGGVISTHPNGQVGSIPLIKKLLLFNIVVFLLDRGRTNNLGIDVIA